MSNYKFIIKPIFYILSLLFSCWMVLKIEKMQPSDFGKYQSLFTKGSTSVITKSNIQYLKQLCKDYKEGTIDSLKFEKQLTLFLQKNKLTP